MSKMVGVSHSIITPDGAMAESSLLAQPAAVVHLSYLPINNGRPESDMPAVTKLDVRMSRGQLDAATAKLHKLAEQLATM